jgi:CHAD domain-containing protein
VDESYVLPDRLADRLDTRLFESYYFDTRDRLLFQAGLTLRRRVENGRSLWQLKLPRDRRRLELEVHGGPTPPELIVETLTAALAGDRTLEPIVVLRTRREPYLVRDSEREVAEVALDSVAVLEGHRVERSFTELELELKQGTQEELEALDKRLRKTGASKRDNRSKLARVLDRGEAPRPDSSEPVAAVVAAMTAQHRALVRHDAGLRADDDPEDVHQLRVATRRARAYLRAAEPLLDRARTEPLREELRWLGRELGTVRDLDVLLDELAREVKSMEAADAKAARPLLARLRRERRRRRLTLLRTLSGPRYAAVLTSLRDADTLAPGVDATSKDLRELASRDLRKLRKAIQAWSPESGDAELHRLRIRLKRARYAAELLAAAGDGGATRFLASAKKLQDVLGEHQDAVVAEERLRALVTPQDSQTTAIVAGRLVERQRARKSFARAQLSKALRKVERGGAVLCR